MIPSALSGARIGPNAVIRLSEAMAAACGASRRDDMFIAAGLGHYLTSVPADMVEEDHVRRLHAALAHAEPAQANSIAADAGLRTGTYLLGNRIPRLAQMVLGMMPAKWAARVLLSAIGNHAWTFAGSGRFSFRVGRPSLLAIDGSPVCADPHAGSPMRHYYAATFERIFSAVLKRRVAVTVSDGPPDCCRMVLSF